MQFFIFIVFPVSVNGNSILSLIEAKKTKTHLWLLCHTLAFNPPANHIHSVCRRHPESEWTGSIYSGSIFPQTTVSSRQNVKDGYLKAVEREQKPVASGGESHGRQEGHGVSFTFIYLFIAKFTLRAGPIHILGNNQNSYESLQVCLKNQMTKFRAIRIY